MQKCINSCVAVSDGNLFKQSVYTLDSGGRWSEVSRRLQLCERRKVKIAVKRLPCLHVDVRKTCAQDCWQDDRIRR